MQGNKAQDGEYINVLNMNRISSVLAMDDTGLSCLNCYCAMIPEKSYAVYDKG